MKLAVISSLETLLNLSATDRIDQSDRPSPPDRELLAVGLGNTLCGLIGGIHAPVLVVPSIFEPELCRALIDHYKQRWGEDSGFMRETDEMTVSVKDYSHKRRTDRDIADERLRNACMVRIHDRLTPEICRQGLFRRLGLSA